MVLARRRGLTFDQWWAEAMRPGQPLVMVTHPSPPAGAVRWPTDRNDRVTWQSALNGAKDGWRRAFEQRDPSPAERAVRDLGDAIDALVVDAEELAEIAAEAELLDLMAVA